MFGAAGLPVDPEQVDVLVRQTEGWPAGLSLAAPSIGERAELGPAVADYLRTEVLDRLAPGELRFLRHPIAALLHPSEGGGCVPCALSAVPAGPRGHGPGALSTSAGRRAWC